jgi:hypothetical protein
MPPHAEPSLKDLVATTAANAQRLAKAQAALFKVELAETGKQAGMGGAFGVATLFIAWFAVLFLLLTIAFVLVAVGLPVWAGMLIVAVLLLIGAAVTGLLAKSNFEKAKGPELAIAELEKTKAALTPPPADTPGTPGA